MSKGARGGVTTVDITVVADDARVSEIARMLGGDAESAVSREHARELLVTAAAAAPPPDVAPRRTVPGQRPKRRA